MKTFHKPARRRSLPNLSEAQESVLLMKVNAATKAAAAGGMCEDSTKGKLAWRHEFLQAKCGVGSLKDIRRAGALLGKVMAALEEVARDGVRWVLHVDSGAADRAVPQYKLGEMMREHELSEAYVRGIASRVLSREGVHLHELSAEDTESLLRVLRGQFHGRKKREEGALPL